MKRCTHITGWTDYPFVELGDISGQQAPIRHITVVRYDGNKYADVITDCGHALSIKAGYIYGQRGRCGDVPGISRRKLERMVMKHVPAKDAAIIQNRGGDKDEQFRRSLEMVLANRKQG